MIITLIAIFNIYTIACCASLMVGQIGTRSVLFGYHTFWLHWIFVARGWYGLYGWRRVRIGTVVKLRRASWQIQEMTGQDLIELTRGVFTSLWDPRLWVAFIIHDLGYWGKPNMDGPEGELHPLWAGRVMCKLFGHPWDQFTKYHSRFLAKKDGQQPSPLCFADKMAIVHMPAWLYLPLIHLTGEVYEYMRDAKTMIESEGHLNSRAWLRDVKVYAAGWVHEFKDGKIDTRTPVKDFGQRSTVTDTGVWK